MISNKDIACRWPEIGSESFWQWAKETPLAVLEENEMPVWKDAREVFDAVKAMGASMIRYPAIRWGVHSFDASAHLPKYPGLADRDLFGEVFSLFKKKGLKITAYCHYGVLHSAVMEHHEDWTARDRDGKPLDWNGNHYKACLSVDSFIYAMREAMYELCSKYSIDALYLDGPTWYCEECFCEACREKYKALHGEDLPEALSFEDGSRQKYNRMRENVIAGILEDLKERLGQWPELPVFFNTTISYHPYSPVGQTERNRIYGDGANTAEVHRPGSFWQIYESIRLGEAIKGVSFSYLPPGPYETLRNFDNLEIDVMGFACLMHGSTPKLGTVSTFIHDKTASKKMSDYIKFSDKHKNVYYKAAPLKETGLVYSRMGIENFAESEASKYKDYFNGAFRAMLQEHIHFDCLFDTQISEERLEGYKALYIPGGFTFTGEKTTVLEKFVRDGGSLLLTGKFGLIDENGKHRNNFVSPELCGCDFISEEPSDVYRGREYRQAGPLYGYSLIPEAYLNLKDEKIRGGFFNENHLLPVSDAVVGLPGLERMIEYCVVKTHGTSEVLADLYLPSGGAFGAPLEFPLGTPPGIILNRLGKGKVIYVAAPIEKHYFIRGLTETRKLYRNIFSILLDNDFSVDIDAPAGVVMNVTEDRENIYLHLLNYCGTMHEKSFSTDCIVPLYDLNVSFSGKLSTASEITCLRNSRKMKLHSENGRRVFNIPALKISETYVLKK
ncbi:MAG: hypothetical protein A2017_07435 [Lentisphaerae bacterium GWF2_44_16]|nr:MAG: hypothetical protein A2017_07435 [Lentisphaerae bacterium GWF2_44_16]